MLALETIVHAVDIAHTPTGAREPSLSKGFKLSFRFSYRWLHRSYPLLTYFDFDGAGQVHRVRLAPVSPCCKAEVKMGAGRGPLNALTCKSCGKTRRRGSDEILTALLVEPFVTEEVCLEQARRFLSFACKLTQPDPLALILFQEAFLSELLEVSRQSDELMPPVANLTGKLRSSVKHTRRRAARELEALTRTTLTQAVANINGVDK